MLTTPTTRARRENAKRYRKVRNDARVEPTLSGDRPSVWPPGGLRVAFRLPSGRQARSDSTSGACAAPGIRSPGTLGGGGSPRARSVSTASVRSGEAAPNFGVGRTRDVGTSSRRTRGRKDGPTGGALPPIGPRSSAADSWGRKEPRAPVPAGLVEHLHEMSIVGVVERLHERLLGRHRNAARQRVLADLRRVALKDQLGGNALHR